MLDPSPRCPGRWSVVEEGRAAASLIEQAAEADLAAGLLTLGCDYQIGN